MCFAISLNEAALSRSLSCIDMFFNNIITLMAGIVLINLSNKVADCVVIWRFEDEPALSKAGSKSICAFSTTCGTALNIRSSEDIACTPT